MTLTNEQLSEIRRLSRLSNWNARSLAFKYGVKTDTMMRVLKKINEADEGED